MQAGSSVRDYVFEAKIGEGGMGEVWRAHHELLDRKVAIKVMASHLMADPEFEARFIKEAQAQARLQHPNIIGATDFFREQGQYFLVMPLIEGQSLEEKLTANRGPLPIEEALRISADVLAALDYAHQRAVIHRDVKPSNILLDHEGRAYLTDFGIALMMGVDRKTRTGIAVGTAHYMSPEQIRRPKSIDHRTDVYSFGCVLYEMLAGRAPFEAGDEDGDTDYVIKEAHIHQTPEPVTKWNAKVAAAIEAVVEHALAKNPDERFVSCGEMARAMNQPVFSPPSKKESSAINLPTTLKKESSGNFVLMGGWVGALLGAVFLPLLMASLPEASTDKLVLGAIVGAVFGFALGSAIASFSQGEI
ncbi:MAG: serine/threonine-protein kinase [Blastocatellia bacterium]